MTNRPDPRWLVLLAILATLTFGAPGLAQTPVPRPAPPTPTPGQPAPGLPTTGQRTPPRAARAGEDPQKGTAILRGYVVSAADGKPLRRALVRATSMEGRNGGVTTTDADGRFEIKELPAGRYNLSANKAGYVTMSYGQRAPQQPGTVLEVLDGQLVEKIGFSMSRGGVITGRVTDEFGEPVAGAQIQAMRYAFQVGGRRLVPAGMGTTDDLGAFRVFGLTPGEYFVNATLRDMSMNVPTGFTNQSAIEGFAPTYYPGTTNASEAQRIVVKTAQETGGVTFALAATRLARINGRVVSSTGEPVGLAMIMLQPADRMQFAMMSNGQSRADGSFQLNGVAPGDYVLSVRPRTAGPTDLATTEFGYARITTGGDDLDNVLITTSRGGIARGVITTDDGTPLPLKPAQIMLMARPTTPETTPMIGGGPPKINDDYTFEISGLMDRRAFMVNLQESPDWALKAVLHNGFDVTDTGVDFVPGQTIDGFEIVFTRKRTDLSGRITNDRGGPALDATVVVFAQDPALWTFSSRFVRSARPDQDGRYQLRGLPPADYLLVAVTDIEPGRWQDPEFLESLRSSAVRVELEEGETEVKDLKITKASP